MLLFTLLHFHSIFCALIPRYNNFRKLEYYYLYHFIIWLFSLSLYALWEWYFKDRLVFLQIYHNSILLLNGILLDLKVISTFRGIFFFFYNLFLMFVYFWAWVSRGRAEREGDRIGSRLPIAQSQMWGSNSSMWYHDLSPHLMFNLLSHPGAPQRNF